MKYLPQNTLAYFQAAFQMHRHDLSDIPVSVFAQSTEAYVYHCGLVKPQEEAVTFYTLNHCASIVQASFTAHEPLPEWALQIMREYTSVSLSQGERLLHYILSITTREMRHFSGYAKASHKYQSIEKVGGTAMKNFIQYIQSLDEHNAVKYYREHPPEATVGEYIKAMSAGFHKGEWGSPDHCSYGGPKWGEVADAASSFLHGTTSMVMLVDTGYALAHNGGPIFNKGMMYTSQDSNQLLTTLDVQRAGQMLDLIGVENTFGIHKTATAIKVAALVKAHKPEAFKGYVDWELVSESRPEADKTHTPHKYDSMFHKPAVVVQKPKAPKVTPPVVKTAPVVEEPKGLPETLVVDGKTVKVTGTWQVYPHQSVTTYTREGSTS